MKKISFIFCIFVVALTFMISSVTTKASTSTANVKSSPGYGNVDVGVVNLNMDQNVNLLKNEAAETGYIEATVSPGMSISVNTTMQINDGAKMVIMQNQGQIIENGRYTATGGALEIKEIVASSVNTTTLKELQVPGKILPIINVNKIANTKNVLSGAELLTI